MRRHLEVVKWPSSVESELAGVTGGAIASFRVPGGLSVIVESAVRSLSSCIIANAY
jgi:hypothetical protein